MPHKRNGTRCIAVECLFTGIGDQVAPDLDLLANGAAFHHERFHHGYPLIVDIPQSLTNLLPGHAALSGNLAVLFPEMQVAEVLSGKPDRQRIREVLSQCRIG